MPASTGAAHGRTGGRLSGGARSKAALNKVVSVKIVGASKTPPSAGMPTEEAVRTQQMAAAVAAAQSMSAAFGLSPGSTAKTHAVAAAAVAAAIGADGSNGALPGS